MTYVSQTTPYRQSWDLTAERLIAVARHAMAGVSGLRKPHSNVDRHSTRALRDVGLITADPSFATIRSLPSNGGLALLETGISQMKGR